MVPPTIVPAIRRTPLETVISTLQARRTFAEEMYSRKIVILREGICIINRKPGAACKL